MDEEGDEEGGFFDLFADENPQSNFSFDVAEAAKTKGVFRNKSRMDKFKVGNYIDVRCLTVSVNDKKCVLTAKKALIGSDINDGEYITNYSGIVDGQIATGFISKVDKSDICITFYNNVYGKITARKLAEELGVKDPNVNYNVGDVAKARVVKCTKLNQSNDDDDDYYKLELSMNTASSTDLSENKKTQNTTQLKPGSILPV